MTTTVPGEIWSCQLASSKLRILRVIGRSAPDHFVLTLNHLPIMPPFAGQRSAMLYAMREWTPEGVSVRS